jgi:predicted alpha-1,6-mannanase (GH76 family)
MNEYKNAITNELFLTAAMRLHQFESILKKSSNYYLNWATREWDWFSKSGLINSDNLINDGLDSSTCQSNKQTTWTYNQGVLLDGLALLSKAVGNGSMVAAAEQIADAAMTKLTSAKGVLVEPCSSGGCNHDQQIFKGVFARHLGAFLPLMEDAAVIARARSFLAANADSLLLKDSCSNGGYMCTYIDT